jgi:hypothetical protein
MKATLFTHTVYGLGHSKSVVFSEKDQVRQRLCISIAS